MIRVGNSLRLVNLARSRSTASLVKVNARSISLSSQQGTNNEGHSHTKYGGAVLLASAAAAAFGVKLYSEFRQQPVLCDTAVSPKKNISRAEVSGKVNKDTGIWVIYDNKVYDITRFIENHPGGPSKIMLAAGKNLEPFWDTYAIHKNASIKGMLKEFYIGDLRKEDWVEVKTTGPFANDPKRHPALSVNSNEPFNGETPSALVNESLLTPNEFFFIRNHLPVPQLTNDMQISVEGAKKTLTLSVDDLKKKFEKKKVVSAIQCAGNRRDEMNKIKKVKGLTWNHNAISNAEWGGVLLKDLLLSASVDPSDPKVKHIHFEGCDVGPSGAPYGASIPADRVFSRDVPVMLAYEMNGEAIPRDHGFPLRIVTPGIVGARNVKWVKRIAVSDVEYDGHWQQNDYKPFSPNIDWHNVDFTKSPAIQELPVTSAICVPADGDTVDEDEDEVTVKGYAYSGGGQGIVRVDVSADGGQTWITAELRQSEQPLDCMYSWTLWECSVPIPEGHNGRMQIMCKAVDSSMNTQPENVAPVWNLRGVCNNSWYRLDLKVVAE